MTGNVAGMLAAIIVAIGLGIVVMSFLVPDRKKANVAVGMGVFVVVIGLFHLGAQAYQRMKYRRSFNQIRDLQRTDLEEIRQRMRERSGQTGGPTATPAAQPQKTK
jgi:hypothetical protein